MGKYLKHAELRDLTDSWEAEEISYSKMVEEVNRIVGEKVGNSNKPKPVLTDPIYQKLFNHLNNEHGLVLLQNEMQEIIRIVENDNISKPKWHYPPEMPPSEKGFELSSIDVIAEVEGYYNGRIFITDNVLRWRGIEPKIDKTQNPIT